jgi:hypothetical protein
MAAPSTRQSHLASWLLAALLASACGTEAPGDGPRCTDGKCDELTDKEAGCATVENASGRTLTRSALGDPIAKLVLDPAGSCPTTYSEIMRKIAANQPGCSGDYTADTTTMVVSEDAQNARAAKMPDGTAADYRLVTLRSCNEQAKHGLFLSLPARAGDDVAALDRRSVELIGFDATAGVFNFYKTDTNNGWEFVGNSHDMVAGGECGACHANGGLVMKELHSPWIYWEEPTGVPVTAGVTELFASTQAKLPGKVANGSILGARSDLAGAILEQIIHAGNQAWIETRTEAAVETASVRQLLEPLFCTGEINLDSTHFPLGFPPPPNPVVEISFDFLLDPRMLGVTTPDGVDGFGGVLVPVPVYRDAIKATGQRVPEVGTGDAALPFVFPERSEIEVNLVGALVDRGVIDQDFAIDVLAIDFTRPIFSADRCALLALAPEVPVSALPEVIGGADSLPARVRAAFVAALRDATTPAAAQLARHLADPNDSARHLERVEQFKSACAALPPATFMERALKIASQRRVLAATAQPEQGYSGAVIESPVMLPTDDLEVDPNARLHPETCDLTTELVVPATP